MTASNPWIWVALAAALAQTLRFILQKKMTISGISPAGATFARFAFAAPVIAMLVIVYAPASGQSLPRLSAGFWIYAMVGGVAQILATMAVLSLFKQRNFAVGMAFKKTEVLLAAVVGLAVLGDKISAGAVCAILIGMVGVLLLSKRQAGFQLDRGATALGLASGALFSVSGVAYRGASLTLENADALLRAGTTLACVTSFQTLIMIVGFALRDPGQIRAVMRQWKAAGLVALASFAGSLGWFTAFTLQTVALVKAVGQVELVFSLIASWMLFSEQVSRREIAGIGLVAASVLILILLG